MSSFYADKKREYEQLAKKSMEQGDYEKAFFYTASAADVTFKLARQCEGDIARAYVKNANDLLATAKKIKEKLGTTTVNSTANDTGSGERSPMQISIPNVTFENISGMEEAKDYVRANVIEPLKNPEKAEKYAYDKGGALLLYGLPGTGKTFFAKAVAGELGIPFYVLHADQIKGSKLGESEKAIAELFAAARSNPMSVIFIDETNDILPARSEQNVHEVTKSVENIILQEVDGIESGSKNPFLLIGATNYPGNLDDAALSRFTKRVEVGLPDSNTRRAILERELKQMKLQFEDAAFDFLAERTAGFSCRDIVNCSKLLKGFAGKKEIDVFSLQFCKENFNYTPVQSKEVAASIVEFKQRIGQ